MKIIFDTSALDSGFKAHAQRGIGRYVRELWHYFQSQKDLPFELSSFDHTMVHGSHIVERAIHGLPFGKQTARQQVVYPLALRNIARGFDIVHFPAHMDSPSWGNVPSVITVLDLIPIVCADLYKAGRSRWRYRFGRFLESRAIRHASGIIAISENTARDVERILKVPAEKIAITPLGVDRKFFDAGQERGKNLAKLRVSLGVVDGQETILYVGGIDPRKNWPMLVNAHAALIEKRREKGRPAPVLIIAGRLEGDDQYPALQAAIKASGSDAHVRLLHAVPDENLLELYAFSDVFFFPSLYEGFGLTVLEALAAGIPVVCSNTSSIPEVAGEAAELVDPRDLRGCVEALDRVLSNSARAAELRARGIVQAQKFSWERAGEATVKAYQRFCLGHAA